MVDLKAILPEEKCDVCERKVKTVFRASKFGPVSFEYCESCLEKGLEPYWAMVAYISAAGSFPDDINSDYVSLVRRILKELNVSEQQFIKDVNDDI
jgi:hypothetical protein